MTNLLTILLENRGVWMKRLTIGSLKVGTNGSLVVSKETHGQSVAITKSAFKEIKRILEIEQKQRYFKFEISPGQSILDAALERSVELDYKCRKGTCGKCTLRIVSGQNHLSEPNQAELNKLENQLSSGFRLACQASAQ